eukprot:349912-Chlamydomonas_euryale.AAC.3
MHGARRANDGAGPVGHFQILAVLHAITDGAVTETLLATLQLLQEPEIARHYHCHHGRLPRGLARRELAVRCRVRPASRRCERPGSTANVASKPRDGRATVWREAAAAMWAVKSRAGI